MTDYILDCGPFEGEPTWAPRYWDMCNKDGDLLYIDPGHELLYLPLFVEDQETLKTDYEALTMWEDMSGYIHHRLVESPEEAITVYSRWAGIEGKEG